MKISVRTVVRLCLVLAVVAGTVALISAPAPPFTEHDKAFYLDENQANFIRPGFVIKILTANIASDGTITARVRITDPKQQPLDKDGIVTPGAVTMSFIAATIPKGQTQYTAYTTRTRTGATSKVTVIQPGADTGGKFDNPATGEYIYTFATKAPASIDKTATHTIGVYGNRNLTEFSLGTQYASDVFTFVPDGSAVKVTRDVIRTASCNKCHDQLSFHGGSRRGMEMCILCHQPQNTDPENGNSVDMPVMIHKIHRGSEMTKPYTIGSSDWSTVVFPGGHGTSAGPTRNCDMCHEATTGAAQATAYLTNPSRKACGACHDNVNFATGENHVSLPQVSDNQCSQCHIPQGELEFDASIKGAHVFPQESSTLPGLAMTIVKVDNGAPGQKPTVTFTLKDKSGKAVALNSGVSASLIMAGPTTDYGYTSFGSDVTTPGYISESVVTNGKCDGTGTCTYTFAHALPADAKGTYGISTQARMSATLMAGTTKQMTTNYAAANNVAYFSVDGSKVAPRRQVVDINKCNGCHATLALHGEQRNQIEFCVMCHNPSQTDKGNRPNAQVAADKTQPNQSVDFGLMIHKIHTGENMQADGRTYIIVGNGGSHNDFSDVRYPVFSPQGSPGDRRNCNMCHVNGSEQLPLKPGMNQVVDPQGLINPVGYTTAVCTGCHTSVAAASHALTNTSTLGEACNVCHDNTAEFSVSKVHAQ